MAETVKLHNTHRTMMAEVFSADGDSVHLMPNSKTDVDKKFLWNLPSGVVEFKQKHTVFGAKGTKEIQNKKGTKENSVSPETPRTTLKTN